ncbi:MAG TPA: hypothetical protein VGD81_15680 [Opitutaceae bacterium]
MMLRTLLTLATATVLPLFLSAQPATTLGRLEGDQYVSPTGAFRVKLPVLPELGGAIDETENVVTFQDQFNVHASIACFPMDATQRWENETRGRRDYLIWFFDNFVQADFQGRFPGSRIESAKFLHGVEGGALLAYNLLPGGSMFEDRIILTANESLPVAKRGNLLFVHDKHVYVLSIELAEKVVERSTYKKTTAEEDEVLRRRLLELLNKMRFTEAAAQK